MRASVLVLGPLLARTGLAKVALPGGCAIGVRPIDQHLKGFQKLGAEVFIRNGYVEARASRLKGARISTDLVTVTGTENLMMAAALAEGTTVIENAAREPEVTDLARLLSAMGARIHGAGTERIEIEGVAELGGLHVVATERHDAGRIDRQLFGRCGRQGDPGSYQVFVSLEDEIVQNTFKGHALRMGRLLERHMRIEDDLGRLKRHDK